jgi:hypothetical protein
LEVFKARRRTRKRGKFCGGTGDDVKVVRATAHIVCKDVHGLVEKRAWVEIKGCLGRRRRVPMQGVIQFVTSNPGDTPCIRCGKGKEEHDLRGNIVGNHNFTGILLEV